jgi:hypothetical protein
MAEAILIDLVRAREEIERLIRRLLPALESWRCDHSLRTR